MRLLAILAMFLGKIIACSAPVTVKRAAFTLVLTLCALVSPAHSATFGLKPVSLTIDAKHPIAQESLSSLSARRTIFDVAVKTWMQVKNQDVLGPASGLVVVPPIFAIDPYDTVPLQAAFRGTVPVSAVEASYKLILTEVLPGGSTPSPSARVLSAPLFVPAVPAIGTASFTLKSTGAAQADLTIVNAANNHVYIGKLSVQSGGRSVYDGKLAAYILAGSTRTLSLRLSAPLGSEAQLEFVDDKQQTESASAVVTK